MEEEMVMESGRKLLLTKLPKETFSLPKECSLRIKLKEKGHPLVIFGRISVFF